MIARHRRLLTLAGVVVLAGAGLAFGLRAFNDNLVFFVTPSELHAKPQRADAMLRVGGLVRQGSIRREAEGLGVSFVLTDLQRDVPVTYRGVLPDLFVEGKGAVAQGRLGPDGTLQAAEVLAKHDENYTAPGVQAALDRAHAASQAK